MYSILPRCFEDWLHTSWIFHLYYYRAHLPWEQIRSFGGWICTSVGNVSIVKAICWTMSLPFSPGRGCTFIYSVDVSSWNCQANMKWWVNKTFTQHKYHLTRTLLPGFDQQGRILVVLCARFLLQLLIIIFQHYLHLETEWKLRNISYLR